MLTIVSSMKTRSAPESSKQLGAGAKRVFLWGAHSKRRALGAEGVEFETPRIETSRELGGGTIAASCSGLGVSSPSGVRSSGVSDFTAF